MAAMLNPVHPGELIREDMEANGWTETETTARLTVSRQTLSRVLDGTAGVSPTMALALERIGWGNAEYWLRVQANYDLARARLGAKAA